MRTFLLGISPPSAAASAKGILGSTVTVSPVSSWTICIFSNFSPVSETENVSKSIVAEISELSKTPAITGFAFNAICPLNGFVWQRAEIVAVSFRYFSSKADISVSNAKSSNVPTSLADIFDDARVDCPSPANSFAKAMKSPCSSA